MCIKGNKSQQQPNQTYDSTAYVVAVNHYILHNRLCFQPSSYRNPSAGPIAAGTFVSQHSTSIFCENHSYTNIRRKLARILTLRMYCSGVKPNSLPAMVKEMSGSSDSLSQSTTAWLLPRNDRESHRPASLSSIWVSVSLLAKATCNTCKHVRLELGNAEQFTLEQVSLTLMCCAAHEAGTT